MGAVYSGEMIKFAKEHDINRYNFYGITGDFGEDAEDAGVQKSKVSMLTFMNIW